MNEQERQKLAEHLAQLSYKKARAEVRRLDAAAKLKYWRNTIHDGWHTTYELPTLGLRVTLVEVPERTPLEDIYRMPAQKVKPIYVEAQVEPLRK